jgi:hypothetical protein
MRVGLRAIAAVVVAFLSACHTGCKEQSWNSPISRIPRPTEPTSTFEGYQPTTVVVVPPFRRTIAGTVRLVSGGPLAGVEIGGPPTGEGDRPRAVTAQDGSFRFDQTLYETLWFRKEGYHPSYWSMSRETYLQEVHTVAIKMQPHIFMASESNFSSLIVPDDITFVGGYPFGDEGQSYECGPCKLIDISAAEQGAILRLSWSGSISAGTVGRQHPELGRSVRACRRPAGRIAARRIDEVPDRRRAGGTRPGHAPDARRTDRVHAGG